MNGSVPFAQPLVLASGLRKTFPGGRTGFLHHERTVAVDGVSLAIERGDALGLVGESGSGKSTLGRLLLRLIQPDEGEIVFDGRYLERLSRSELRPLRSRMQIVFQDPYTSLNPRMRARQIVGFNLPRSAGLSKAEKQERVEGAIALVGLGRDMLDRYPHQLSGGQAQRVGIARALVTRPEFLVADEPVSALDVSVQAGILNLFLELRERLGLTTVFISHNLDVVRYVSERIAVMWRGQIVETGARDVLYEAPRHPYTRLLLSAIPTGDGRTPSAEKTRERQALREELARAPLAAPLREVAAGHFVAEGDA